MFVVNGLRIRTVEDQFEWFSKAAEQGLARAQSTVGACYFSGKGVEQDYELAREWSVKAAEQGHADTQFMLDIHFPDPVYGPRLQPDITPPALKFLKALAKKERKATSRNH